MAKKRNSAEGTRKLITGLIVAVIVVVIGAGVAFYLLQPEKQVTKKLDALAQEYYENYYYDNLMAEHAEASELSEYKEGGLPTVKLRQLLLYDSAERAEDREFLEAYSCDTNWTRVKYYPEEPYGRENYRAEWTVECEV